MKNKSVLVILGIVLTVLQLVSFIGMSRMYVGLYPDRDDLLYPTKLTTGESLNAKKFLFAIEAGADRFNSSFEDLTYSEDEYRSMTATQIASAMVRESLDCSKGGSIGLTIYDIVLTFSYSFIGILGIGFLLAAFIAHKLEERKKWENFWEEKKKAKERKE